MSALRKNLYYFWKKLSEKSVRRKYKDTFFKKDFERFEKCTQRKSVERMRQEMKALQNYWGCYPFQYYRFDFYKQDCDLTVEEMKTYVPLFFLHHLYFPLSYKDYGILCEDKLLTYALLKAYEVPQPKLLFCFDHNQFFDQANERITKVEVDALINTSTATKLFVKPRFGSEGKGIVVLNRNGNTFIDEQHRPFTHLFFEQSKRAVGRDASGFYIVQEGLTQHDELRAIYPSAVNTYRAITECVNGEVRMLYCVVRMGSGGRQIDNASAGGIFVRIDLETGVLYESAQAFDQSICYKHPDTGFLFKDAIMETWPAVKAFTLAVAGKFREIRFLGWDVAVTKDGPAVIEFNNKPDFAGIQDSYGGIRDALKITPKDWWYQSNFTLKNL